MNSVAFRHKTIPKQQLLNQISIKHPYISKPWEQYWTIIGAGSIGAKAEELMKKTKAILEAGFFMPARIVFAMGFFDDFKKRNRIYDAIERGAESKEIMELVKNGTFTKDELSILRKLVKKFHTEHRGVPFMVRSSAHGDSSGTGIYDSVPILNFNNEQKTLDGIARAIKSVLASEFSNEAVAFRKNMGIPDGMAVIIEPIFGQHTAKMIHEESKLRGKRCFTSVYGGFAFSSRGALPGYIFLTSGLPHNAVAGKGLRIDLEDKRTLSDILYEEHERLSSVMCNKDRFSHIKHNLGVTLVNSYNGVEFATCFSPESSIDAKYLDWLVFKLKKLEKLCEKPQYVEWAVIEENRQLKVALLQVSDAHLVPNDHYKEILRTEKTIAEAIYVRGSKTLDCNALVYFDTVRAANYLAKLNERLKDYILLYFTGFTRCRHSLFSYADVSNANVIAETDISLHSRLPEGHISGKFSETGKIFLGLPKFDISKLGEPDETIPLGDGFIYIFKRRFQVISSEAQQKAVISLED